MDSRRAVDPTHPATDPANRPSNTASADPRSPCAGPDRSARRPPRRLAATRPSSDRASAPPADTAGRRRTPARSRRTGTGAAGAPARRRLDGVERIDPKLAGGSRRRRRSGCGANTPRVAAGDDRQRRIAIERLRVVAPREIERSAAARRRRTGPLRRRSAARASRTAPRSPRASAAGRATGSRSRSLCVWPISTAPGVSLAPPSISRAISPTNCRFVQMYMNASVHMAKPNAPRANGIGALPSQHTGSHSGAVNRRASHTFAKYRSASTGGGDDSSSSDRVRWPEPPQMSMARRRAVEHGRADRARDGLGDDVGRIGEAVEKIAALEIRSERLNDVAVGRGVGRRRPPRTRRPASSSRPNIVRRARSGRPASI